MDVPMVPVSWGELLDKVTILEIKRARLRSSAARANVVRELDLLAAIAGPVIDRDGVADPLHKLRAVNEELWDIEDAIRVEETKEIFGDRFVALARSVYRKNDERAAWKRAINDALGSMLTEEKSYGERTDATEPGCAG